MSCIHRLGSKRSGTRVGVLTTVPVVIMMKNIIIIIFLLYDNEE